MSCVGIQATGIIEFLDRFRNERWCALHQTQAPLMIWRNETVGKPKTKNLIVDERDKKAGAFGVIFCAVWGGLRLWGGGARSGKRRNRPVRYQAALCALARSPDPHRALNRKVKAGNSPARPAT